MIKEDTYHYSNQGSYMLWVIEDIQMTVCGVRLNVTVCDVLQNPGDDGEHKSCD